MGKYLINGQEVALEDVASDSVEDPTEPVSIDGVPAQGDERDIPAEDPAPYGEIYGETVTLFRRDQNSISEHLCNMGIAGLLFKGRLTVF